jgi:hypothetical protein
MIESLKEGPEKEYLKTLNKGMAGKGNEEKEQFEMKMANAKVDANEKYKSFLALNTKLQPEAYKTMTAAQRTELREAEKAYIAETKGAVSKLDGIHEGLSPEEKERVIEADQKSAKIISERIAKDKLDAKKSALATADAIQAKLFLRGDGTAENKAMTANEIAKLPAETLIREEVAQHLGAAALTQAIESGNLTDEHVSTIVSTIVKNRETADRKVLETIAKGTKNLTLSTSEQRRLIQEALVSRDGAQAPAEESKIIIPPGSKTA